MNIFPDDQMAPNIYGSKLGKSSKEKIANAFASNRWSVRKSSWYDYEAENEYSELQIEGDDPNSILINGCLLQPDKNIPMVGKVLESLGLEWQFELYDNEGELIKEYVSKSL